MSRNRFFKMLAVFMLGGLIHWRLLVKEIVYVNGERQYLFQELRNMYGESNRQIFLSGEINDVDDLGYCDNVAEQIDKMDLKKGYIISILECEIVIDN